MLRKSCLLIVCLAICLTACKRKAEPEKPAEVTKIAAPAGMAHVPGTKPPVFISTAPVTQDEYLAFLEASGQPVPETLQVIPSEAEPITVLTLEQARRFATWHMVRLPTADEWARAADIVGAGAYPWGELADPNEPRADAPLFPVQDWTEGSAGEQEARGKKEALLAILLAENRDRIVALRGQLESLPAEGSVRLQEKWQAMKPALFTVLQQKRELVELAARQERQNSALQILQEVGREKNKQVHLKVTGATQQERDAEADKYKQFLADYRNGVQKTRDELLQSNQQAQEKMLELKKDLDEAGQGAAAKLDAVAHAALKGADVQVESFETARSLQERLRLGVQRLRETEQTLQTALQQAAEGLEAESKDLAKKIEQLSAQEQTALQIEDMQESITKLSEYVEKQFLHEALLFKELAELTEASTRKQALEAEAAQIEYLLELLLGPEEAGPEQPAEAGAEEPEQPPEAP